MRLEKHQYPKGISPKLAPRWFGPYKIQDKKGEKAYILDMPKTLKMTCVFNTKRLELWKEDDRFPERQQVLMPLPEVTPDGEQEFEVEAIISHRTRNTRNKSRTEYLVKWKGYDHCEDTWLPEYELGSAQEKLNTYRQHEGLN